jgi:hypothetical protein
VVNYGPAAARSRDRLVVNTALAYSKGKKLKIDIRTGSIIIAFPSHSAVTRPHHGPYSSFPLIYLLNFIINIPRVYDPRRSILTGASTSSGKRKEYLPKGLDPQTYTQAGVLMHVRVP